MQKILVLGMGKVGSLVGCLLNKRFDVKGLDKIQPHYEMEYPFEVITADVTDQKQMTEIINDFDTVVSALPYFLNAKNCKNLS